MTRQFHDELEASFASHSDRVAIEFPRRTWRFAELEQAAEQVAAIYQGRGLAPGDRLLLCVEAKEPFLLAYLGAAWCGAVPVPLNPGLRPAELDYFLRDSRAAAVVCDPASEAVLRVLPQQSAPQLILSASELLEGSPPRPFRSVPVRADDPALMLYSSGTTGEPKGVVHTQTNLARAVRAIIDAWQFNADDVLANVLPLFHIHGLSFATHVSLLAGSTMLVADAFHPIRTLDLIDRATVFMAVPPYYHALLNRDEFRARAARWTQLRLATCGSAPIRPDVLPVLEATLGRPVINRYGMTECHVLTSLPIAGPWPHGSVGAPLAGVEVVVRDARGRTCAANEVGAVHARGPNLFREYWGRPDATAEAFDRDGWFDTGDLGQTDDRGFLTLIGRSKDLIIVGGFNVYPAVVERALCEFPGVREAAVVGIPDEARGERVAAFVVADACELNAAELRRFCRERLTDYQCPTFVELVPLLPRGPIGKVLKRELRDQFVRQRTGQQPP